MIQVNREEFMLWSTGLLLDNDKGSVLCFDRKEHQEAEDAMERGETIVLMVEGKPFSTMSLQGDGFEEELIDD